jgi:hypothetical protein
MSEYDARRVSHRGENQPAIFAQPKTPGFQNLSRRQPDRGPMRWVAQHR